VSIPAKRVPYFKPGKELKELINEDNASNSTVAQTPAGDEASDNDTDQTPPLM